MKTLLSLIIILSSLTLHAGPAVSGGDPTETPIVQGLVDGYRVPYNSKGYKMVIELVEVSAQDLPSKTLLKVTYEGIQNFPHFSVPFTLAGVKNFSSQATYQLQVLIDVDGDGKLSKGDYINTDTVIVRPFHPDDFVYVALKKI